MTMKIRTVTKGHYCRQATEAMSKTQAGTDLLVHPEPERVKSFTRASQRQRSVT